MTKGLTPTLAASLMLLAGAAPSHAGEAAASATSNTHMATQADADYVYGAEVMTREELAEHRAKLKSFKTEQEREAYMMSHHDRMNARAQERGIELPSEATASGRAGVSADTDASARMDGKGMKGGADAGVSVDAGVKAGIR